MSGWINDGLRILTDYFGAEDEEEEAVVIRACEEEATPRTTSASNNDLHTTERPNKRKAVDSDDVDPVPSNKNAYENGLALSKRSYEGTETRFRQSESKSQEMEDGDDADDTGKGEVVELHPLFAMHLEELKQFIAEHGHMNVPGKDKSGKRSKVRSWMIRQRSRYMALPNAYCNNRVMAQAEIDALNAIGFQWEAAEHGELPRSFAVFLDELKQFVAEHGHLHVPPADHTGRRSSLRNWMINQRLRYKALPDAYYNNRVMTRAEIDALNGIGFQWELPEIKSKSPQSPAWQTPTDMGRKTVARISSAVKKIGSDRQTRKVWPKKSPILWTSGKDNELDATFRERLDELQAFVAEHGHMKPPSFVNGNRCRLYNWMNHQRLRRRASPNRYHNSRSIRQAEIDALDAIEFDWELARTPSEPEVAKAAVKKRNSGSAASPSAKSPVTRQSARKRPRHSPSREAEAKPVVESPAEEQLDPCFQARFQDLRNFQSKHGHMEAKSGPVYNWIKYQRLRRRAFPKRYTKRSRPMTRAEIDALDALGFDWRGANDDDYE